MPKSTLILKSTVTRSRAAEPVAQAERQQQAEHHQAVENAAQTTVEAATAMQATEAVPKPKVELQSAFLTGNLGKPVTVFTINGLRLAGRLRQFDQFTLLLEGQDGISLLVFKHAVTTIAPASEVPRKQRQPQ